MPHALILRRGAERCGQPLGRELLLWDELGLRSQGVDTFAPEEELVADARGKDGCRLASAQPLRGGTRPALVHYRGHSWE